LTNRLSEARADKSETRFDRPGARCRTRRGFGKGSACGVSGAQHHAV